MLGKTGKPRAGVPRLEQSGKEVSQQVMALYGPDFLEGSRLRGHTRHALWSGGFGLWLSLATGPVPMVGVLEEVLAFDVGAETGAGQESPCQLAVQGIGLLWRGAEPMLQQHRDEALHSACSVTRPEVIRSLGGEGLPQDHHSLHVGIRECLGVGESRGTQYGQEAFYLTLKGQVALSSLRVSGTSTSPSSFQSPRERSSLLLLPKETALHSLSEPPINKQPSLSRTEKQPPFLDPQYPPAAPHSLPLE